MVVINNIKPHQYTEMHKCTGYRGRTTAALNSCISGGSVAAKVKGAAGTDDDDEHCVSNKLFTVKVQDFDTRVNYMNTCLIMCTRMDG